VRVDERRARRTAMRLALVALGVAAATALLLARAPGGSRAGEPGPDADPARAAPLRPVSERVHPRLLEAAAWAGRGAWDSAAVELVRHVEASEGRGDALVDAYRLASIGAWMGILARDRVEEFRRALRRVEGDLSPPLAADVAWLDGLLAFIDHDGRRMDEARLRLRDTGAGPATDLERSLRGFQLALDGDEVRGARMLRRLEEDRAGRTGTGPPGRDVSFLTPVNRIAAAHWFIRNGRSADALELLDPPAPAAPASAGAGVADITLAAFVHLQRARAQAALGLDGAAREDFREFLRRYDLPEGPARGWARDAREALDGEAPVPRR